MQSKSRIGYITAFMLGLFAPSYAQNPIVVPPKNPQTSECKLTESDLLAQYLLLGQRKLVRTFVNSSNPTDQNRCTTEYRIFKVEFQGGTYIITLAADYEKERSLIRQRVEINPENGTGALIREYPQEGKNVAKRCNIRYPIEVSSGRIITFGKGTTLCTEIGKKVTK